MLFSPARTHLCEEGLSGGLLGTATLALARQCFNLGSSKFSQTLKIPGFPLLRAVATAFRAP